MEDPWSNLALIEENKGTLSASRDHFITSGVSLEILPPVNYYPCEKAQGVLMVSGENPVAALGHHGQGRVVQFAWSNPDYWGGTCAMTPSVDGTANLFPSWEYFLSQVARDSLVSATGTRPEDPPTFPSRPIGITRQPGADHRSPGEHANRRGLCTQ